MADGGVTSGGQVSFLVGDQLGSASVTLWANGSVHGRLRYDPWGETRYTYATTPTGYRYTGQREDSLLKLYDYNARYYDPQIGRFLTADTIVPDSNQKAPSLTVGFHEAAMLGRIGESGGGGPFNPQALNRYSYVLNAPIGNTDPTGHETASTDLSLEDAQNLLDYIDGLIADLNLSVIDLDTIASIFSPFADFMSSSGGLMAAVGGLLGQIGGMTVAAGTVGATVVAGAAIAAPILLVLGAILLVAGVALWATTTFLTDRVTLLNNTIGTLGAFRSSLSDVIEQGRSTDATSIKFSVTQQIGRDFLVFQLNGGYNAGAGDAFHTPMHDWTAKYMIEWMVDTYASPASPVTVTYWYGTYTYDGNMWDRH